MPLTFPPWSSWRVLITHKIVQQNCISGHLFPAPRHTTVIEGGVQVPQSSDIKVSLLRTQAMLLRSSTGLGYPRMKTCVITKKWANITTSFHFPWENLATAWKALMQAGNERYPHNSNPLCQLAQESPMRWQGHLCSSINQEQCSRRISSPRLQERTETWAIWDHCSKALECPGVFVPTYLKTSFSSDQHKEG